MDGKSPQGLCPNGWHIPSVAEWSSVVSYGAKKMSNDFYIYPGNYNLNTSCIDITSGRGDCITYPVGWKERDSSGFYWTSSGNSYFTGFWDGRYCKSGTTCIVEAETGASATDIFSVRCIADDDLKLSCGTGLYAPATQFCFSNSIYAKCSGNEYDPTKRECVDGALISMVDPDYIIECTGGIDEARCGGKKTVNLKVGECVEINVMDYTDQYNLPTVGMRCDVHGTQANVSVALALNGKSKTYTSSSFNVQPIVELGKIRLGNNEFGILCVYNLSGATSVNCNGPGQ